jgi:hypothetical protein
MWLFRILFAFDALVFLVLGYFFVDGLQYSGSTGPSALWLPTLAVPLAVLAGAWALRAQGKSRLASLLLAIAAIPPLLFVLFFGLLLLLNPNWQ